MLDRNSSFTEEVWDSEIRDSLQDWFFSMRSIELNKEIFLKLNHYQCANKEFTLNLNEIMEIICSKKLYETWTILTNKANLENEIQPTPTKSIESKKSILKV